MTKIVEIRSQNYDIPRDTRLTHTTPGPAEIQWEPLTADILPGKDVSVRAGKWFNRDGPGRRSVDMLRIATYTHS